jgi:CDP-glycerol glycerophosphotransferase
MAEEIGDDHFLLVRTHYLERFTMPRKMSGFAREVSDHDDVSELLLAADVLITDYSSVMFDYSLLRRPIIFFAYDYSSYVSGQRGTYIDLRIEAPGPIVATTDEVVACLRKGDAILDSYRDKYDAWVGRFGQYETGHASRDVVQAVFHEDR